MKYIFTIFGIRTFYFVHYKIAEFYVFYYICVLLCFINFLNKGFNRILFSQVN